MSNKTKNNRRAERRKHISQMSLSDIDRINNAMSEISLDNWDLSFHALNRMREKRMPVTRTDIFNCINSSNIVEYKEILGGFKRNRVLFVKDIHEKEIKLNVVFDMTTKAVITVWTNHISDNHDTLDMSIYDKNLKVSL